MKTLIEVKDYKNNFKIVDTIERVIKQNVSGGIMRVQYKNKSYVVMGGIRNNIFITVNGAF